MKKTAIIYIVIIIVAIAGIYWAATRPVGPGKLDEFASCIDKSGAKFFGAFWCPHCQATKKLFGSSVKLLPYIECSTPDGKSQLPQCNDAKIESYPTWEFADGSRLTGELSLETISNKTGCALPQ
jgi:hypothetical protein